MAAPIHLYVDEISPEKIKATVSKGRTIAYNLKVLEMAGFLFYAHSDRGGMIQNLRQEQPGITIIPIGRFICLLVKQEKGKGMIFLDLVDKQDLAEKMAQKLNQADLQEEFMQAYAEIISHPERHNRYELIVGKAEVLS
jgi:hypothetical protein